MTDSTSHSSRRKKKRTQKHGKKKSKSIKDKSKKLKRHHVSASGSHVYHKLVSVSMVSESSSRSEDKCRSRRARKRDISKVSKKKIKRDSSISDSSGDTLPSKKRKRSNTSMKKHIGKKKRRRERSSSFSSDDCLRILEKKGDQREMKERDQRVKGRERNRSKRSRHSSSCSSSETHSYASDERVEEDNPSKRLKSVIVATRKMAKVQVQESSTDELKDKIVYEHDDGYPSMINDNNDGTSIREDALASSWGRSDEKTMYTEEPSKEACSLDLKTSEFLRIERLFVERSVSTADASSNSLDLERMLRQKALENLLQRQGKLPKMIEEGGSRGDQCIHNKLENMHRCNLESAQKADMTNHVKYMSTVPASTKDSVVYPPIHKLETELYLEKDNAYDCPVISRAKLGLSTSAVRLLGPSNTWRRDTTLQVSPRPNSLTSKETVVQNSPKSIEFQSPDTKIVAENLELPVISRGESTKEVTKEDGDSEFEQKTMTVMQGGELVQVSYKVKIPKKTPTLARRQFKQ